MNPTSEIPSFEEYPEPPCGRRRNSKELLDWSIEQDVVEERGTAAVSIGRNPNGVSKPVEEFDPRSVRNNIGDAQLLLTL
jgi:hypothetical protein